MSLYDGKPHKIYGYLNSVQWKNLNPEQITKLEKGYSFDDDIDIIIAKDEIKDVLEHFHKDKIENFVIVDEKGIHKPIYTLVCLSNHLPDDFHNNKENPISLTVLAMRLYKRGMMINNIAFSISNGVWQYYAEKPKTDYLVSYNYPWGHPYRISYDELEHIKEIYELIKKPSNIKNQDLRIASEKLDDYNSDIDKRKKLLSIFTGIEVLLKKNKPKINIKEYLAEECARLLAENKTEVEEIKTIIVDGYKYRSGFLHNGKVNDQQKLENVIEKCHDYLCRLMIVKMKFNSQ